MGELLGIDPRTIDVHERFSRYGLDSRGSITLVKGLAERLKRAVSPVVVWQHPTPHALARHLFELGASRRDSLGGGATATAPVASPRSTADDEPIAIVGMACRFPGAPAVGAYWQLLRDGTSAIREVPRDRWDVDAMLDAQPAKRGHGGARWGGFLDQVDGFDPLFFGISPREAIAMDPQQRLMLELTWEALEDAGIVPERLRGSRTGVYFGSAWVDYATLLYQRGGPGITQYTVTGHHRSILANRVSYVFGLHGPSMAIDTACSSSLVAVHLACEGLLRGDATVALAGGVNLNLLADSATGVSEFGALSPDGRCFTFDARANGYVRGEGGGVVVLKRLSRAIADGDPIHCVVHGAAVNNDGPSNGLTAPNPVAQESLLRVAYERAAIDVDDVQYVELHGTGTQLGDPIEASALGKVIGQSRSPTRPLRVGSAKTNVGHLEAAAGMAGLIKAALCIRHRRLVPSIQFETPNPHIPFADLRLDVQRAYEAWPDMERRLVAGVSSFGMGGTNAHVVLSEWPSAPARPFALAAASDEALRRAAQKALDGGLSDTESWSATARAATGAAVAPAATGHRLAFAARSARDVERGLRDFLDGGASPRVASGRVDPDARPKVVFVFAGQGAQWLGMGLSLLHREPVFRATLERCARLIEARLGWSLIGELTAGRDHSRLDDVEVGWPASIAIQIALADLWRTWGVEPAAVIGHSGGEIAAAHVGGALDLTDAIDVICVYARMLERVRGKGAMGVVGLSWDEASAALTGYEGRVFPAIHHGVDATVLAGEPPAIDELFRALDARHVFCRKIPVDVAPHSPLVAHLRGELDAALGGVRPRASTIPIASASTGTLLAGERFDADHWVRNFCEPLSFSPAIDRLIHDGYAVFVEVSPHPSTLHAIQANFRQKERRGVFLPSLRRDEDERDVMLDTLGALYVLGAPVRWDRVDGADALASPPAVSPVPVPISARGEAALRAQARSLRTHVESHPDMCVNDIAYSLAATRTHFEERAVVVATDRESLVHGLRAIEDGVSAPGVIHGNAKISGKVVFTFPGQGSQWVGMARPLLATSDVFRERIDACAGALAPHVDWSLLAVLCGDDGSPPLDRVDVLQPVLFAVMVALAALWRHAGVEPDAVVGHSQGEIAAACVAGALSLDDAAKVVALRSRALARLAGRGTMALVELTAADVAPRLARFGERLSIAAVNGPRTTVVSGELDAMESLLAELQANDVFVRKIRVDYASHGPHVDSIRDELLGVLAGIQPRTAVVPMMSTVTGEAIDGAELGPEYWYRNLRRTVRLVDAVQSLALSGHRFFIEVSPHPVLTLSVKETLDATDAMCAVIGSLRRDAGDQGQFMLAVSELHARGFALDWRRVLPPGQRAPLPTYPFQRERYWVDTPRAGSRDRAATGRGVFGPPIVSSLGERTWLWEGVVSAEIVPYLADHQVDGRVVVPGVAYASMVFDAAPKSPWASGARIDDMELHAAMEIAPQTARVVQLAMIGQEDGTASFRVSSRDAATDGLDAAWVLHATGALRAATATTHDAARDIEHAPVALVAIQSRCGQRVAAAEHYASLAAQRLDYGPAFAGVTAVWRGRDEALASIAWSPSPTQDVAHRLDPRLLDAALQVALATDVRYPSRDAGAALMPVGWKALRVHAFPRRGDVVWSHARLRETRTAERLMVIDVVVSDASGRKLVEVDGLRVKRLKASRDRERVLRIEWQEVDRADPRPDMANAVAPAGPWIVVGSGDFAESVRARLESRGQTVRLVDAVDLAAGDGMRASSRLRECLAASGACAGVVHLASLALAPDVDAPSMVMATEPVWASALHLVQAVTRQGLRDAPRLWLVTRGVQSVGGPLDAAPGGAPIAHAADDDSLERDMCRALAGAPLLGIGRTLVYEHPELRCTRIDLSSSSAREANDLVEELLAHRPEDEVALRGDRRFVARLAYGPPGPRAGDADEPSFREDASYLVTGGFGGLGLSLARWMADRGARRIVLTSRSAPSGAARDVARELEARGARVVLVPADVSRADDVAGLLREANTDIAPLRGIFHLAGILDDGLLAQQDVARFRRVMAPKVDGAWHLHRLTRGRELDFFVLYSSVASLFGSPGQTNYAGANGFLNALAAHRRAANLPAVSVAWGPISDIGLAAARESRGERLQDRGMESLSPARGEAALGSILVRDEACVGVAPLDVGRWFDFYPPLGASTFFGGLMGAGSGPVREPHGALLEKLRASPAPMRVAQMEGVVRSQLGRVLQCRPDAVAPHVPFTTVGLDSLTGLELRNRIEAETGLRLPATIIWARGNIASLARDLVDRMFPVAPAPEAPKAPEAPDWTSAKTEDELMAELAQELDDLEGP